MARRRHHRGRRVTAPLLCFLTFAFALPVHADAAARQQALDATQRFLDARESGALRDVYDMFSTGLRTHMTFATFEQTVRSAREASGPLKTFEVLRVLEYEGPPVRVAVDFMAEYEAGIAECGYLIWTAETDIYVELSRIHAGRLDADLVGTGQGAEMMKDLGCIVYPGPVPSPGGETTP